MDVAISCVKKIIKFFKSRFQELRNSTSMEIIMLLYLLRV
jgi:hypothetical protein